MKKKLLAFSAGRLRELRGELSRAAVGEAIGRTGQTIREWERGRSSPDADDLAALADLFRCSIVKFFDSKKEHRMNKSEWTSMDAAQRADVLARDPWVAARYGWSDLTAEQRAEVVDRAPASAAQYGWADLTAEQRDFVFERAPLAAAAYGWSDLTAEQRAVVADRAPAVAARYGWAGSCVLCGPDGLPRHHLRRGTHDGVAWMDYGCESRSVEDWRDHLDKICARHAGSDGPIYSEWLRQRLADCQPGEECT